MVSLQSLSSLSFALYDPAAEKKRRGRGNLQVRAWCGEEEYRRRILATKVLRGETRIIPAEAQESGGLQEECQRLGVCVGGGLMCATCAIMSSTMFGHGLVRAEPEYPFASSERRAQRPGVAERGGADWVRSGDYKPGRWHPGSPTRRR